MKQWILSLVVLLDCTIRAAGAAAGPALEEARNQMVDESILAVGITHPGVVRALRDTPRHQFVPLRLRKYAYYDMALPIGASQTISPPFIVAHMTAELDPQPTDRVLEIGTGSGYQAAVLSPLVWEVYTIEIVESLGRRAAHTLKRLNYTNVHVRIADGYKGWPEQAPFDKIIVTCSPEQVPAALVAQLKEGGLMVVPVGSRYQQTLFLFEKIGGKLTSKAHLPTLFVPMTGTAEQQRRELPDPGHPAIRNGSFELRTGKDAAAPAGWHYVRQFRIVEGAADVPDRRAYITFANDEPGRLSQALQGFAIDGRKVAMLALSIWVKARLLRPGPALDQRPGVVVTFYDASRGTIGAGALGPWQGTFVWREETARIRVPLAAREAIVRIGLLGAAGEISFDDFNLHAVAAGP